LLFAIAKKKARWSEIQHVNFFSLVFKVDQNFGFAAVCFLFSLVACTRFAWWC
jgi:hypothetical protein